MTRTPAAPEPDVKAILAGFRAVLELDATYQIAEASDQAKTLTEAQLARAAAAIASYGLAVSAEQRQRRRGEGAHV